MDRGNPFGGAVPPAGDHRGRRHAVVGRVRFDRREDPGVLPEHVLGASAGGVERADPALGRPAGRAEVEGHGGVRLAGGSGPTAFEVQPTRRILAVRLGPAGALWCQPAESLLVAGTTVAPMNQPGSHDRAHRPPLPRSSSQPERAPEGHFFHGLLEDAYGRQAS